MTAPPPDDPHEPDGSRDPRKLDFDAEFERIVADWTPSDPPDDPADPSVEPTSPSIEPTSPSVEPVETNEPTDPSDARAENNNLQDLFRRAWPDEDVPERQERDPDEHFVPPPVPPIPRPEPRRLLAWAGLVVAPLIALVLLVVGALPSWASFLFFCWFVGGFAYLVATMGDSGRDGWDDGAQV